MATWRATATDEEEEEAQETLFDKIKGKITGFWGWIVRLLIFLFVAWLFFSVMAALSMESTEVEKVTHTAMEQEDADSVIRQTDKRLWAYMMNIANGLSNLDEPFDLGGDKSQEFGEAYFQTSDAVYVKSVRFYNDRVNGRTAEITYEMGVNKDIHLIFQNNHIRKEMTRYEGFSEGGSFLRYLKWYTYGRFMKGYPRYTCEVAMQDGVELGSRSVSKVTVRLKPFSKIVYAFGRLRSVI